MTAVSRPSAVTSVSSYNKPTINAEGSIDSFFGPDEAKEKGDWIRTVPGKGWFPMFRFYRPSEAYFDETWKLGDVVAVSDVPVEVQISGKCRDGTAFPLFHSGRECAARSPRLPGARPTAADVARARAGTKPLSDASARNLCRASGCSARCTCGPVGAGTSDEAPSS